LTHEEIVPFSAAIRQC